jgi:hypothetical protein
MTADEHYSDQHAAGVVVDKADKSMPAYRFSWTPFDDATVGALAAHLGYHGAVDGTRAYLAAQVRRPNDEFVRRTKEDHRAVLASPTPSGRSGSGSRAL